VGLEGRAGYFDQSGALRDMVQNHMLQLVMMSAMDLQGYSAKDKIRERKRSVIDSLKVYEKEEIIHHIVRGQYVDGTINGEKIIGYLDEPGITETSTNDTFIAARLCIDNPSWEGVPFFIRTGKRMVEKTTKIVIEFKNPLKEVLKKNMKFYPNLLIININPNEGITLQLNSKNPMSGQIEPISVDFSESKVGISEAYEFLIMDAIKGGINLLCALAGSGQPILDAFHEKLVPLHAYSAGSMGPEAATELLIKDGFHWW
jgi:glucose-6-phosphate 1-dehydrogenase